MAAYRVAAKYVTLKLLDSVSGKAQVHGFYEGAIVPSSVEADSLKKHLDSGMVVEVDESEVPAEEPSEPKTEAPAGNANRQEWADYARTQGASEDELKDPSEGGLGRDDLRAKYGA